MRPDGRGDAVRDLERRVRDLTAQAVARDPGVLRATTGGAPLDGSQDDVNRIVMAALAGIREAIIEIARELDRLADRVD